VLHAGVGKSPRMSAEVELARRQWLEGSGRYDEELRSSGRADALLAALETVTDELRRRVGQTFTLEELAFEYGRADAWVRSAVSERAVFPGWPRYLTTVQDAAFHLYSRGATDYRP